MIMKTIEVKALRQLLDAGRKLSLLDVRAEREHREVHIPGVVLETLDSLNPARVAGLFNISAESPLYVICRSGSRAKQAMAKLEQAGISDCVLVEGGTQAWVAAGYPVNRGEAMVISLERQVRIAAGALVFTGTVLGALIHPAFLLLSGGVGAGLIFAGVTDRCGLALAIARMPWNRGSGNASCACHSSQQI
jgi:rhodanese-related sulfurtransferase